LGCEGSLDITSRDKVNARKDPSIIESITKRGADISKEALNATSIFETEQRVDKFQAIQENLRTKFLSRTDPVYVPGKVDLELEDVSEYFIPGKYDLNVSLETSNEARGAVEPGSGTPD